MRRGEIEHTFVAPCQPEGSQGTDDPEDIVRVDRIDLSLRWVRPVDSQSRARSCDNLLFLCACKLAQDRLCDGCRRLDCQRVHKHIRSGSHGGQLALWPRRPECSSRQHDCNEAELEREQCHCWVKAGGRRGNTIQ